MILFFINIKWIYSGWERKGTKYLTFNNERRVKKGLKLRKKEPSRFLQCDIEITEEKSFFVENIEERDEGRDGMQTKLERWREKEKWINFYLDWQTSQKKFSCAFLRLFKFYSLELCPFVIVDSLSELFRAPVSVEW